MISDHRREGYTPSSYKKGGFHSGIHQNPSDSDTTYRIKSGEEYQGYIVNLEERIGENGAVITGYQYEKNTHSGSQFLKDSETDAGRGNNPDCGPSLFRKNMILRLRKISIL